MVRGHDADDSLGAVAEVEHERDVELDEVAEPGRIEPPGRMREADGQLRSPRHMVVGFPAVHGLELLLGENLPHVDIVESTLAKLLVVSHVRAGGRNSTVRPNEAASLGSGFSLK